MRLFGWDELPTELERPKRYVPVELSKVPRERIQAQLRRVPPRMGLTSPKFTASTSDATGNRARNREPKSTSQQEEWDWRSWKKSKKGEVEEEVQEELIVFWK